MAEPRSTSLDALQAMRGPDSGELFRALVETIVDYAIFMLDVHGNVASWNAGAARLKGYTADEIIGRHFSAFYPQVDIDAGKCEMELEVALRDGRFEDEGWRVRKDGTEFWANVVITAVRDKLGVPVGFAKVTRDLTERKRTEDERALRLAAEHANATKDQFLAMLGHELRNPLAPIVTALQLIKMRGDGTSSREHEIIERQVTHMMNLVDDLLDVSRIASGKIELRITQLDVRDAVTKAIEIAMPLFESAGHHFAVEVGDEPVIVEGDDARLTQVFTNLLTNAAKYTPPGGHVVLTLRAAGDLAIVEVRDDGKGIEPDLLPRVFDLFVQGRQDVDRPAGGLGLGLTLVRSLVERHGGQVEAHSPGAGHGSAFTVKLPIVTAPSRRATTSTTTDSHAARTGKRVLLVDDNDDARLLLADYLGTVGHEVMTAADGVRALELVAELAPELAILDIGLPVMDGYELARRLRELAPATKLIAVTGYGQRSDQERTREAGFDRHMVKPVDLRRLMKSIEELTGDPE